MSLSEHNDSYPEPDGRSGTHVPITRATVKYDSDANLNEPSSRKVNPTPCIVVIVPGSVAITYRTHFNYISQSYFAFNTTKV